ncbi:MAG: 6,7-dimethyl-8-ribityllumazine synthase [Deltaproteobacteria bacterium]|nr:6,7-dimethyl-8-ribityllumazine synthase [Deltaproteobacteria bacterium]
MTKVIEGVFDASGLKAVLVASRFNDFIVARLLDGAVDALVRHGMASDDITIVRVPGAFEIPQAVNAAAQSKKYDMAIALGAVIRGSTPHFDYIASEVAKGVAQTALASSIPVSFGVLTTDTLEQAIERAGSKAGNKGAEAAMSAIEMAGLLKSIES